MRVKKIDKPCIEKDNGSEEYLTDPTIPAIAKEMHCNANFEYKFKTKAYYKGKKLEPDEVQRLYNLIQSL